jgi:hypothetical protein
MIEQQLPAVVQPRALARDFDELSLFFLGSLLPS